MEEAKECLAILSPGDADGYAVAISHQSERSTRLAQALEHKARNALGFLHFLIYTFLCVFWQLEYSRLVRLDSLLPRNPVDDRLAKLIVVMSEVRMTGLTLEAMKSVLEMYLEPWYRSVAAPALAQEQVLRFLLDIYAQTEHGAARGAAQVATAVDYRRSFPVTTYDGYLPLIKRVMETGLEPLVHETPLAWAITRGTTEGESKFIPMTPTDMRMRASAGRAVMNYALRSERFEVLQGANLNLNFPSIVGRVKTGEEELEYGYSSGIYLRHTTSSLIRSLPKQEDIDALGGGTTISDWERRFELAYEQAKDTNITFVGGVAPTAVSFGRYLYQKHGLYPKDLWQVRVMTLGSVPGINTRYVPILRALYGPVEVIEIYGATEGMFGQQRDDKRAWVPNFDLFYFEVETRRGTKMLYEMEPGETGSLVVSTPTLPRYKIGDLIRAFKPPYYRCIGRDRPLTHLRYWWDSFMLWEFDEL